MIPIAILHCSFAGSMNYQQLRLLLLSLVWWLNTKKPSSRFALG